MNDHDSEMHEFTLSSANKYKDGTPMMSEPKSNQVDKFGVDFCEEECCPHWESCPHTLWDKQHCPYLPQDTDSHLKYLEQAFKEFAKNQDELIEEYDATLKSHGDTLEEHLDRICELEGLYENMLEDLCVIRDRLCKITDLLVGQNEHAHIFSNFCGNCIHAEMKDGICTCELSGELIDPDSASCSLFDPSFTYVGKEPRDERPDWLEKIHKTMTTPSEPSVGCADCKHAIHGMCVKYNCSLGAICATPECHESYPF